MAGAAADSSALGEIIAVGVCRVVSLVECRIDTALGALCFFDLNRHLGLLHVRDSGQIILEHLLKKVFLALNF